MRNDRMQFPLVLFIVSMIVNLVSPRANAESWMGFEKRDFKVAERNAFLIIPKQPAQNAPWIWRTEFFGHEPQADIALLEHGFHVAYVDMQNLYGGPAAMEIMDAMHAHIVKEYHLSPKTVLEGFSRGGLFSLNWAARNPGKVACVYNDAPVCDFKSWPGGRGKGKGSPADWERCKQVYGLKSDEEAIAYKLNPVDNLGPMAQAKIPILHVCGATDDVVPVDENSLLIKQRYEQLGGPFVLINKPNCNHHPHSLKDPTRIVNFVLTHTGFSEAVRAPSTPFGYDYFELRGGLTNSYQQFTSKKQGRVAFLGGSITASNGWRDAVCESLKKRFPNTTFDFINAGIPSLGSTPGAFRFERDVLAHGAVDLLFEEAAVNDDTNGFSDTEQVRGMEGIVRHAFLSNPKMDVVLLHFADPGKLNDYRQGRTPAVIANHERVAQHYQLPSINLAREVTERIDAGEFTWEKDFKDLHPDPFGHALYANSIERLFATAWAFPPSTSAAQDRVLPKPLDLASYFSGKLISPNAIATDNQTKMESGWKLEPAWKPTDKAGTRDGFVNVPALVCDQPGKILTTRFQGNGVGVFVTSGPDTGTLEYKIDDDQWRTCELYTVWSNQLHLPWAKMLASGLTDGPHQIQLRVSETSDQRSKGHTICIVHFLVN